ncbi:MAG: YybS family protein [Proteobacteria bacterium]|nr:YybS family protein [Pseudomonadota bacterium]
MEGNIPVASSGRKMLAIYLASVGLSFLAFHSILLSILTPLPQFFVSLRLGRWAGVSLVLLCALLTGISGFQVSMAYLMQFGVPAIVFSEAMRRGFSVEKSFLYSTLVLMLVAVFAIGFYASTQELGMSEAVGRFVESVIIESVDLNEKAGVKSEPLAEFRKAAPEIGRIASGLYPAMLASAALIMLWLNTMLLGRVLSQHGLDSPFGDLSSWKVSEHLVWGVVLGGLAVFAGAGTMKLVGINILVVLSVIYFFQGMAILSFYFRRRGFSPFLKGAAYLVAVRYVSLVVVAIGLFDMWADFRKLSPKEEEGA